MKRGRLTLPNGVSTSFSRRFSRSTGLSSPEPPMIPICQVKVTQVFIRHANGMSGYHNTETSVQPFHCPWHVCVCMRECVCTRVGARVFWTLLMCLWVYVSGRSWGRWVGRECESEIFTYLFYIVILNPYTFLSPCGKGKFSFLCFVYWWIIRFIWFDLIIGTVPRSVLGWTWLIL